MSSHITIPRRDAVHKIRAAIRATFYYQHRGGTLHQAPATVGAVIQAFLGSPTMRLKVRLEDSQHDVQAVHNSEEIRGYLLEYT